MRERESERVSERERSEHQKGVAGKTDMQQINYSASNIYLQGQLVRRPMLVGNVGTKKQGIPSSQDIIIKP